MNKLPQKIESERSDKTMHQSSSTVDKIVLLNNKGNQVKFEEGSVCLILKYRISLFALFYYSEIPYIQIYLISFI